MLTPVRLRARSNRSMKCERLHRPVSSSWRAEYSRRSAMALRWVTSSTWPMTSLLPSAWSTNENDTDAHMTRPSARM